MSMESRKEISQRRARRAAGLLLGAVLAGGGMSLASWLLAPTAADTAAERLFVCAKTGRAFRARVQPGMTFPIRSPYSAQNTGYPAELCYWNADGTTRHTPTAVLLNSYLGQAEPTFCPDCGRLVVAHNPPPSTTRPPPPTAQEHQQQDED